jgi:hypothetical protein
VPSADADALPYDAASIEGECQVLPYWLRIGADPPPIVPKPMVAERGGVELMPELGYKPVNRYLPPRPKKTGCGSGKSAALEAAFDPAAMHPALRWLDRILTR